MKAFLVCEIHCPSCQFAMWRIGRLVQCRTASCVNRDIPFAEPTIELVPLQQQEIQPGRGGTIHLPSDPAKLHDHIIHSQKEALAAFTSTTEDGWSRNLPDATGINDAIAKAINAPNWVIMKRGLYFRPNAKGYTSNLNEAWKVMEENAKLYAYPHDEPVTIKRITIDYAGDLNAIHEVIEGLLFSQRQEYYRQLQIIRSRELADDQLVAMQECIDATAAERAEAVLLALL